MEAVSRASGGPPPQWAPLTLCAALLPGPSPAPSCSSSAVGPLLVAEGARRGGGRGCVWLRAHRARCSPLLAVAAQWRRRSRLRLCGSSRQRSCGPGSPQPSSTVAAAVAAPPLFILLWWLLLVLFGKMILIPLTRNRFPTFHQSTRTERK